MSIRDLGENLFLFQFNQEADRNRVLLNGPWSFDNHFLLLKQFEGDLHPKGVQLTMALFWIRVYALSFLYMNEEVGKLIGNAIGSVEEVEILEGRGGRDGYFRIRVSIDVRKPLKRGLNFSIGGLQQFWIYFRYERMPNICFFCGCIGHMERDCEKALKLRSEGVKPQHQYGVWLRAVNDKGGGRRG